MELIQHAGAESPCTIRFKRQDLEALAFILQFTGIMDTVVMNVPEDRIQSLKQKTEEALGQMQAAKSGTIDLEVSRQERFDMAEITLYPSGVRTPEVDSKQGEIRKFFESISRIEQKIHPLDYPPEMRCKLPWLFQEHE
jgi:hypothetical protein